MIKVATWNIFRSGYFKSNRLYLPVSVLYLYDSVAHISDTGFSPSFDQLLVYFILSSWKLRSLAAWNLYAWGCAGVIREKYFPRNLLRSKIGEGGFYSVVNRAYASFTSQAKPSHATPELLPLRKISPAEFYSEKMSRTQILLPPPTPVMSLTLLKGLNQKCSALLKRPIVKLL